MMLSFREADILDRFTKKEGPPITSRVEFILDDNNLMTFTGIFIGDGSNDDKEVKNNIKECLVNNGFDKKTLVNKVGRGDLLSLVERLEQCIAGQNIWITGRSLDDGNDHVRCFVIHMKVRL